MKRNEFLKLSGGLALAGLASKSGFASLAGEAAKLKNFGSNSGVFVMILQKILKEY
jgi:hypothetical protein